MLPEQVLTVDIRRLTWAIAGLRTPLFVSAPVRRRGERYADILVRQAKPVTVARRGRLITRRIFRRGSEKRAPPQSSEGDHG